MTTMSYILSRRDLVLQVSAMLAGILAPKSVWSMKMEPVMPGDVTIYNQRCEYAVSPLGIDEPAPRLSWAVRAKERAWRQSAYQIVASSDAAKAAAGYGDLWDTGKVASNVSSQIAYGGRSLKAGQQCFWSVRVWDAAGHISSWSPAAHWEMGLLHESDWQGSAWIGRPAKPEAASLDTLDGVSWIWHAEPGVNPAQSAPSGVRWFRARFDIPADSVCEAAMLAFTVDDAYDARLNGHQVAEGGHNDDWRAMKVKDVTALIQPGTNVIAFAATNDKDAAGLACRLKVTLTGGKTIVVVSDESWKSAATEAAGWDAVGFDDHAWKPAQVVAKMGEGPWGHIAPHASTAGEPSPLLRREFDLKPSIRRARVYASGIGYADIHVNGHRLGGASERDPGYTAFDKRVLYVTYDVTSLVKQGHNAIGAVLGTGWYDVHDLATWNFERATWHGTPRLRLLLAVEYTNGHTEHIVSDDSWRIGEGPIRRDGIYSGEIYDARLEIPGWDKTGFDDKSWTAAAILPAPADKIVARACPPVAVTMDIAPIGIKEMKPGVFVVDFGQNFTGHVKLNVKAPAGTAVTMRYGEKVHEDGPLDTANIDYFMTKTSPPQIFQSDTYICKGGEETWEQRFSYSGFRYAEVTGLPALEKRNVTGRFAHTAVESAGEFSCSDEMLNKIQAATHWSYLGNAQSIPTDCPQREKNGWTADAHLAAEAGIMNFQTASFYTKWLDDFADNQLEDGRVGDIIPSGGWGTGGCHPAWDSAYAIIAWDLYRYSGDTRILARHFDHIARYVDYLVGRTEDGVVPFDSLGDWLPWKTETSSKLTSTVFLYHDARILADSARILGREADADKYDALAEKTKQAFNAKWYDAPKNVYGQGEQTAQAMPLYFGMVPEDRQKAVFAALVANLEAQGHIDSGILGAKYIIRVLAEHGRSDLAYKIVTRKEIPSWAYWIEQGATTLWEDWKGKESLNHIMFGDVSNWFYQWIAGIGLNANAPGFTHILIQPQPVGDLTWAKAHYDSLHGRIVSEWKRDAKSFHLKISIPANTTATVTLPVTDRSRITEGGKAADQVTALYFLKRSSAEAVYSIGSGDYEFAVQEV